jgi:hypothetical protein
MKPPATTPGMQRKMAPAHYVRSSGVQRTLREWLSTSEFGPGADISRAVIQLLLVQWTLVMQI